MSESNDYTDMNFVFYKGIPKLMQVADDMNRMANYMEDLRNITIIVIGLSALGILMFFASRYMRKHGIMKKRNRFLATTNQSAPQLNLPDSKNGYPPKYPGEMKGITINVEKPSDSSTPTTNVSES